MRDDLCIPYVQYFKQWNMIHLDRRSPGVDHDKFEDFQLCLMTPKGKCKVTSVFILHLTPSYYSYNTQKP